LGVRDGETDRPKGSQLAAGQPNSTGSRLFRGRTRGG